MSVYGMCLAWHNSACQKMMTVSTISFLFNAFVSLFLQAHMILWGDTAPFCKASWA